jgi:hypothetical protein
MQLNEILENNTLRDMCVKTNIAEKNIEAIMNSEFDKIRKTNAIGFISIIEREYNVDLSELKKQALEYYETVYEDTSITLSQDLMEESSGRSGFFKLIGFLLIIYAIWYAFENFDREKLNSILPFTEVNFENKNIEDKRDSEELSIEYINSVENTTIDTDKKSN